MNNLPLLVGKHTDATKPIEFRSTELTDETLDGSWMLEISLPLHRVRRL
jgi:hypothetical protein